MQDSLDLAKGPGEFLLAVAYGCFSRVVLAGLLALLGTPHWNHQLRVPWGQRGGKGGH